MANDELVDPEAAPPIPKLFGLSGGDAGSYAPEFTSQTGRAPAFQGLFWTLEVDWSQATWATPMLDEMVALGSVPVIEITTTQFDDFVASGSENLTEMVRLLSNWTSSSAENRFLVAPFPEANLSAHPWGKDRATFIEGYVRVVQAFRDAGVSPDDVRFIWALNGGIAEPLTYASYYPGDDVVDIVGFTKLNRNDPWRDYEESFGRHIEEIRAELTTSKPIIAYQTGSVVETGDRGQWLRDMFGNLAAHEQVIGAIYFNRDKFEGGKQNDYRIVTDGTVDPVVISDYPTWSPPGETAWIFDGRLDAWVAAREDGSEEDGGFVDTADSVFVADIAWLAETGITRGCNPPANTRFCPDEFVTRGQMAAFLNRGLELPQGGAIDFSDDDGAVFEADIERLAAAGITRGCNPPANTRFCPDEFVSRGQMAAFLHRALGG